MGGRRGARGGYEATGKFKLMQGAFRLRFDPHGAEGFGFNMTSVEAIRDLLASPELPKAVFFAQVIPCAVNSMQRRSAGLTSRRDRFSSRPLVLSPQRLVLRGRWPRDPAVSRPLQQQLQRLQGSGVCCNVASAAWTRMSHCHGGPRGCRP